MKNNEGLGLAEEIFSKYNSNNILVRNRFKNGGVEDNNDDVENAAAKVHNINLDIKEDAVYVRKKFGSICRRLLKSMGLFEELEHDFEDIVQDSWLKYYQAAKDGRIKNKDGKIKDSEFHYLYAYAIVRYQIVDILRRKKRKPTIISGGVDVNPKDIIDSALVPSYAEQTPGSVFEENEEKNRKNKLYTTAFHPLGYSGKMKHFATKDGVRINYGREIRNLKVLQLLLEGKNGEEIARQIFPAGRYNYDDPKDKDRAVNSIRQYVHRYMSEVLEDIAREVGAPLKNIDRDFLKEIV